MNIFDEIKKIIKRINQIDIKSRVMARDNKYSSNPFTMNKSKTYAWIEKNEKKDSNNC